MSWSVQTAWNKTITVPKIKKTEPRNFLYASELGRSLFDVYHSLIGIEPTNAITDAVRRKMEAGNFYESLVVWVFQRCGILIETQGKARTPETENSIAVYGRFDILAGTEKSQESWSKKKEHLDILFRQLEEIKFDFPFLSQVKKLSENLVEYLSTEYPDGIEAKIYEVKSLNSLAFWREGAPISTPYSHHINQLSFYQDHNERGIKNGSFLYIDRDTMSVSELVNIPKEDQRQERKKWIESITKHYRERIEPPKPEPILFSKERDQYQFNWEIERSPYADMIIPSSDKQKILDEIKKRNKNLKEKRLMEAAFRNEDKFGTKKYKKAIQMILEGKTIGETEKAAGVPAHALKHYCEIAKVEVK